jgi:hypothetical protein
VRCSPRAARTTLAAAPAPHSAPDANPTGSASAPARYASFKFAEQQAGSSADAASSSSSSINLEQIKAGRILVSLFRARHAGAERADRAVLGASTGSGSEQALQLPEGKKCFLAPSLKCGTGGTKTGTVWSKERYEKVGGAAGGRGRERACAPGRAGRACARSRPGMLRCASRPWPPSCTLLPPPSILPHTQ